MLSNHTSHGIIGGANHQHPRLPHPHSPFPPRPHRYHPPPRSPFLRPCLFLLLLTQTSHQTHRKRLQEQQLLHPAKATKMIMMNCMRHQHRNNNTAVFSSHLRSVAICMLMRTSWMRCKPCSSRPITVLSSKIREV